MNNKQIIFGLFTGALTAVLGLLIVTISQAGWNLLLVGFALSVVALIARHAHQKDLGLLSDVNNSEATLGNH